MADGYSAYGEGIRKISVIGDNPTVVGFKLAGVKRVFEVKDNLKEIFETEMKSAEVSILVINENLLEKLPPKLKTLAENSIDPIVVPIPDKDAKESKSASLRALINRAIGFDMVGE